MKKHYVSLAATLIMLPMSVGAMVNPVKSENSVEKRNSAVSAQEKKSVSSELMDLKREFYLLYKEDDVPFKKSLSDGERRGAATSFKNKLDACINETKKFSKDVWNAMKKNSTLDGLINSIIPSGEFSPEDNAATYFLLTDNDEDKKSIIMFEESEKSEIRQMEEEPVSLRTIASYILNESGYLSCRDPDEIKDGEKIDEAVGAMGKLSKELLKDWYNSIPDALKDQKIISLCHVCNDRGSIYHHLRMSKKKYDALSADAEKASEKKMADQLISYLYDLFLAQVFCANRNFKEIIEIEDVKEFIKRTQEGALRFLLEHNQIPWLASSLEYNAKNQSVQIDEEQSKSRLYGFEGVNDGQISDDLKQKAASNFEDAMVIFACCKEEEDGVHFDAKKYQELESSDTKIQRAFRELVKLRGKAFDEASCHLLWKIYAADTDVRDGEGGNFRYDESSLEAIVSDFFTAKNRITGQNSDRWSSGGLYASKYIAKFLFEKIVTLTEKAKEEIGNGTKDIVFSPECQLSLLAGGICAPLVQGLHHCEAGQMESAVTAFAQYVNDEPKSAESFLQTADFSTLLRIVVTIASNNVFSKVFALENGGIEAAMYATLFNQKLDGAYGVPYQRHIGGWHLHKDNFWRMIYGNSNGKIRREEIDPVDTDNNNRENGRNNNYNHRNNHDGTYEQGYTFDEVDLIFGRYGGGVGSAADEYSDEYDDVDRDDEYDNARTYDDGLDEYGGIGYDDYFDGEYDNARAYGNSFDEYGDDYNRYDFDREDNSDYYGRVVPYVMNRAMNLYLIDTILDKYQQLASMVVRKYAEDGSTPNPNIWNQFKIKKNQRAILQDILAEKTYLKKDLVEDFFSGFNLQAQENYEDIFLDLLRNVNTSHHDKERAVNEIISWLEKNDKKITLNLVKDAIAYVSVDKLDELLLRTNLPENGAHDVYRSLFGKKYSDEIRWKIANWIVTQYEGNIPLDIVRDFVNFIPSRNLTGMLDLISDQVIDAFCINIFDNNGCSNRIKNATADWLKVKNKRISPELAIRVIGDVCSSELDDFLKRVNLQKEEFCTFCESIMNMMSRQDDTERTKIADWSIDHLERNFTQDEKIENSIKLAPIVISYVSPDKINALLDYISLRNDLENILHQMLTSNNCSFTAKCGIFEWIKTKYNWDIPFILLKEIINLLSYYFDRIEWDKIPDERLVEVMNDESYANNYGGNKNKEKIAKAIVEKRKEFSPDLAKSIIIFISNYKNVSELLKAIRQKSEAVEFEKFCISLIRNRDYDENALVYWLICNYQNITADLAEYLIKGIKCVREFRGTFSCAAEFLDYAYLQLQEKGIKPEDIYASFLKKSKRDQVVADWIADRCANEGNIPLDLSVDVIVRASNDKVNNLMDHVSGKDADSICLHLIEKDFHYIDGKIKVANWLATKHVGNIKLNLAKSAIQYVPYEKIEDFLKHISSEDLEPLYMEESKNLNNTLRTRVANWLATELKENISVDFAKNIILSLSSFEKVNKLLDFIYQNSEKVEFEKFCTHTITWKEISGYPCAKATISWVMNHYENISLELAECAIERIRLFIPFTSRSTISLDKVYALLNYICQKRQEKGENLEEICKNFLEKGGYFGRKVISNWITDKYNAQENISLDLFGRIIECVSKDKVINLLRCVSNADLEAACRSTVRPHYSDEVAVSIIQRYEELRDQGVVISRELANLIVQYTGRNSSPFSGLERLLRLIPREVDRSTFFNGVSPVNSETIRQWINEQSSDEEGRGGSAEEEEEEYLDEKFSQLS